MSESAWDIQHRLKPFMTQVEIVGENGKATDIICAGTLEGWRNLLSATNAENAALRQQVAAVQGVINALLSSIEAHCGDPEAGGGYRYLCSTCAANWDAIQELRLALGGKENE